MCGGVGGGCLDEGRTLDSECDKEHEPVCVFGWLPIREGMSIMGHVSHQRFGNYGYPCKSHILMGLR